MNFELEMKKANRTGLLIAALHLFVMLNFAIELVFFY